MSRSRKKNPVISNVSMNHKSLKKDKKRSSKITRIRAKIELNTASNFEGYITIFPKECVERYSFADDGKQWIDKDSLNYEKYKRK